MFKSKKTYIKRYASKNIDKKIKFSSGISSEFGNGGKISAIKPSSNVNNYKNKDSLNAKNYSGEIKFADSKIEFKPKYKFTGVEGDGKIEPGRVVSGAGVIKPEPIDKPDLTNVKADAHVRPVIDGKSQADTFETKEHKPSVSKEEQTAVVKEAPTVAVAEKPTEVKIVQTVVKSHEQPKEKAKPRQKPQNINNQPRPAGMKNVSASGRSRNPMPAVVASIIVVIGLLGAGGYYGFRYLAKQIELTNLLNSELAVVYAPEDYMYPEVPQDIAAKVKADRDAAYNRAVANAYVPKRAEVPNLFKYDYVKTCYLTFDDGPNPDVTASILDTLKQYGVPATFFVVGKNAVAYPDLIKRMDAEGHAIGNHSYSHDYDYMYSGDIEFDNEMNKCKSAINNILGKSYPNLLYRFPGGSFEVYKQYYIWNIEAEGYQYVDWTALTGDSEIQDPDADYIMNTLKESTNNGTKEDIVVLMHDAGAKKITADTLPQVIEYLKSKNYVFKAVTNSNYTPQ